MKLYRKQLNSIDELKREKARLLLLRKKTKEEDFFSMKDVMPSFGKQDENVKRETKADSSRDSGWQDITDMLGGVLDAGMLQNILGTAGGVFAGFAGKKLRSKVLVPVVKELLGAYVKWKAVELGFSAVKHFVRSKKKKAEQA